MRAATRSGWLRWIGEVGQIAVLTLAVSACQRPESGGDAQTPTEEESHESGWSQILISFQGAMNSRTDRPREEAKQLAQDLLRRLQGGTSFERLAHTYSDHPSALQGGGSSQERRWLRRWSVYQYLDPGQVGQTVVETAEGFHVVKRN